MTNGYQQAQGQRNLLERLGAKKAFYAKHFELEIIVSTKTAMALHRVAYLLYPGNQLNIEPRRCITASVATSSHRSSS